MKVKTSELNGAALDWAVDKCEGYSPIDHSKLATVVLERKNARGVMQPEHITNLRFSTDWAQGGPIIEREDISFRKYHNPKSDAHGKYYAMICRESGTTVHWKGWGAMPQNGPTPLIAAMRCYVASKLGDEVDVPSTFINK
jgi:hypothetical protein